MSKKPFPHPFKAENITFYRCLVLICFIITGPELPVALYGHSMVPLGFGQIIIGGMSNGNVQSKIYFLTCTTGNCVISTLIQELSVPRSNFMAITISDTISGCISDRK